MDRIPPSEGGDAGSTPAGSTKSKPRLEAGFCVDYFAGFKSFATFALRRAAVFFFINFDFKALSIAL